ncbi:TetR/AcrR family transcriptional regulator [Streptomyces sp. WMMB 322]|uniref:TetR/AcrR family transcriptional regulator n=1 Tax=Streptomyces sp. WMMB 322 TaxID=1286821 RepID=UPI0006E3E631|nr:TetR/AcrR family transcriptional regulator [Streptomyces sp. WMMB 322]SCK55080.1 transcriptional regulator, TetR family [Streptomyces sp. WMMB 322]
MAPSEPSRRRAGRPRSAEADAAIMEATREALVEVGWSKLTVGHVAARAGVAKTTLYRRWANKGELVVHAVAALFDELELPDCGSLRADIEFVVLAFAGLLQRPGTNASLMAVVAESTHDTVLREHIREAIVERQKRLVLQGRQRAQARGELPAASADPAEDAQLVDMIFDVIAGAVVHRTLVSAEPVDAEWAGRFTSLFLHGLAAASSP